MPDSEYSVKIYAGGHYIISEEHEVAQGNYSGSASVAGNTNRAEGNEGLFNQTNERLPTVLQKNIQRVKEGTPLKIEMNQYANMDIKDNNNQSFEDTPSRINQNASGFPYGI
jgi:hypothetical protein